MANPALLPAIINGVKGACPRCGEGRLFSGYLKLKPACDHCHQDFTAYRADDGPAYFTILIVGHLVVAPLLIFPFVWQWPWQAVLPMVLVPLALITLALLRLTKGGFFAVLWANGVKAEDHAPGEELAASDVKPR